MHNGENAFEVLLCLSNYNRANDVAVCVAVCMATDS